MNNLPSFAPAHDWVPAPPEYVPCQYGSVYPPIQKLSDGRMIVDQCRMLDGSYEVIIFDNQDHPNIKLLPEDVPEAIKTPYRKASQLRALRRTGCVGVLGEMEALERAWVRYLDQR